MTQETDEERVAPLDEADRLSTAPDQRPAIAVPRLGGAGMLRWAWRQLTSMRIALTLLFMLSLAAIPGSLLPQNEIDPSKVLTFYEQHKTWSPILNRLQLFDVFESVWFGAIYTLLFISLVGCIVPRSIAHFRAMRAAPPAAPRNLRRLPVHASFTTGAGAEETVAAAAKLLKRRRFRVVTGSDASGGSAGNSADGSADGSVNVNDVAGGAWVASDKGFLRETGNLVFHLALIGILIAVCVGHFFGFKGAVLVTQGTGFSDTVAGYDTLTMGQAVSPADLPPFRIVVNNFTATYETSQDQYGAPRTFNAYATYQATPTSPTKNVDLQVNSPLNSNGTNIYLLGHGYAPVVTVKDGKGKVVFDGPVTFLGLDAMFDSSGAIKVPDAQPEGLGFEGDLLPTAYQVPGQAPASIFPALGNPVLILTAYAGNLNMNGGESQSVYTLDTSQMKQLDVRPKGAAADAANAIELTEGKSATLPNGLGSITFDGVDQWVQLNIAYDPGQPIALASALLAILGLLGSLGIKRRRIWVRVGALEDGGRLVEVAGLARTEGATPTAEVTALAESLAKLLNSEPSGTDSSGADSPGANSSSTTSSGTGLSSTELLDSGAPAPTSLPSPSTPSRPDANTGASA